MPSPLPLMVFVPLRTALSLAVTVIHAAIERTEDPVNAQVHPVQTRDGGIALQFEHPTLAGTAVGGWMNRLEDLPQVRLSPDHILLQSSTQKYMRMRLGVGKLPACMTQWSAALSAQEAPEAPPPAVEENGALAKGEAVRVFSMEEVEKHDTRDSAWFVHKGQVRAR